jgi:hypothetical protein
VVVLDLWLTSDTMLRGTPAMQLLSYYRDLGKAVVALRRLGGPPGSFPGDGVELVPWPPTRRELLGLCSANSQVTAHARYMSGQRTKSLENWQTMIRT